MLITEMTLLAAVTALILTLLNSLLIVSTRRHSAQQIEDVRTELDATLSASQGLARHIRAQNSDRTVEPSDPKEQPSSDLSESEMEIVSHLKPLRALRSRGVHA